jgi:predicted nucleotidyltransferase
MNKPHYPYKVASNGHYYFFESKGSSNISKAVGFILRNEDEQLVELVFGDLTEENIIDVLSVSNNQDFPKVITTVIYTLIDYLDKFPEKTVYFQGSTTSRTRLYRATIAKVIYQNELSYEVFGITDSDEVEAFDKNTNYKGFIIRKKL